MSTTYIGFNQGQYGDLFIGLTACRKLKENNPECNIIYSVNKKFADSIPILEMSEDIDGFIVWDAYDGWPSEKDNENLRNLAKKNEHIDYHMFSPMQEHSIHDWYNYWHQTEEVCVMHGLPRPTEEEMNFRINKPELEEEKTITICTGRRIVKNNSINPKSLSTELIDIVKNFAEKNNLKLIQIGGSDEEEIEGVERFKGSYSDSVIKVLRSKLLVSCDTGMIWAASAFSHPTIGLYESSYYDSAKHCKNWTPKNKNQTTLSANKIGGISPSALKDALAKKHNGRPTETSYSKEQQDLFAKKLIGENGFFLDIGCDHPSRGNNTKLLEQNGWNGLAFDIGPNLELWGQQGRRATTYNVDASSEDFIDILKTHKIKEVDYISLDIDEDSFGCLKNLISADIQFKCMTLEHTWDLNNMHLNCVEDSRELLTNRGYKLLFKDVRITPNNEDGHGFKPFEDWWVNEDIYNRYGETYQNIIHSDTLNIL